MDVVDSNGKILSWEDYGITIIFPPGAIPEGKEILIRVHRCIGGPFILPSGYRLVSPVYFISPSCEFLKDVELWIAHHAYLTTTEQSSRMTFMTNDPNRSIKQSARDCCLAVREGGRFLVNGVVGRISVRHFCPNAIATEDTPLKPPTPGQLQ